MDADDSPRQMVIYCGFYRETEVVQPVVYLGGIAGETDCIECGGTGWWGFGPPGTEGICINCKGTGRILVSV